MKTIFHSHADRGHANFGWLDSFHSFSFGNYYNPEKTNFGALRVLNDDVVTPSMGFGTHPHDNMEIVSIPLYGELAHKDSTGTNGVILTGDVQIMSAGSGIRHSEFNHSPDKNVNFLQIWILPKERNIEPRYAQKSYSPVERKNKWQCVVSPNDSNAVWINQDAYFSLSTLEPSHTLTYTLQTKGNGVYIFLISGKVKINDHVLERRDALGVWDVEGLQIDAEISSEILCIEVPMKI
ncbi:pirin family protein [Leptospira ognonensis]|uniref:Pirin family protein n=1 Tax=Leptospira ognonensis TaxID=2484945 RepID=A0A4R9K8P1_9LEPT|nr:pirin family protein [Leptospira ognonensis]TGL61856.1 pirin family protein [Leptospira ognonensis]